MTNADKLILDITKKCLKNNISLHLVAKDSVEADENITCSGYFDEKDLVVACKKKDWLDILVHESCHMDQFIGKYPLWKDSDKSMLQFDAWLGGKKVSRKQLVIYVQNVIEMELDCEKRSVKKIKKYNLDIDLNNYRQQVNAYLWSYWATLRDRKWYPFPYNKPHIVREMPKTFLSLDEYFNPEIEILELYK